MCELGAWLKREGTKTDLTGERKRMNKELVSKSRIYCPYSTVLSFCGDPAYLPSHLVQVNREFS